MEFRPANLPGFVNIIFSKRMADIIAGVDEVGRGALFGPVVAASVILDPKYVAELVALGVKDSKQLKANQRVTLRCKSLESRLLTLWTCSMTL